MPVQLQAQSHIQCSGHPCIHGQKQQEEEAHQEGPQIKEVAVVVKAIIKVANRAHHCQEEEQDQEEAQNQEEPDHLQQEEDQEEAAQHRGQPHRFGGYGFSGCTRGIATPTGSYFTFGPPEQCCSVWRKGVR